MRWLRLAVPEPVHIHGKVVDRLPLHRVSLTVRGQTKVRTRWLKRSSFEVEADDGARVRVECDDPYLALAPSYSRSGPWRDVRQHRRARGFQHLTLDDEAHVTVTSCAVLGNRVVTVVGEALDDGADGVARVRAHRVVNGELRTLGAERDSLVERPPVGLALIAVSLSAVSALGLSAWAYSSDDTLTPLAVDALLIGVVSVTTAVATWSITQRPPVFFDGPKAVDWRPPGWVVFITIASWLIALWVLVACDYRARLDAIEGVINNLDDMITGCLVQLGLLLAWLLALGARTISRSAELLQASPVERPGETPGRFRGRVHDPTPLLSSDAIAAVDERYDVYDEAPPSESVRVETRAGFLVKGDDWTVEADPERLVWASDVGRYRRWRGFISFRVPHRGRLELAASVVPQDAEVVVYSGANTKWPYALTETERGRPLLFATRPGGDPLEVLRAALRRRVAVLSLVVLTAPLILLIAHLARPSLPPSNPYPGLLRGR